MCIQVVMSVVAIATGFEGVFGLCRITLGLSQQLGEET